MITSASVLSCDAGLVVGPDFRFRVQTSLRLQRLNIWLDVTAPLSYGHSHLLYKMKGRDWHHLFNAVKSENKWDLSNTVWKHHKGIPLCYCGDSDRFDPKETKESIYWSAPYIIVMSPPGGCPLPVLCWRLRGSLLLSPLFTCITTVEIWRSQKAIHHYTQTSLQLDRD